MIPGLIAHGIGGRTDLPLSPWMFGYGAAAALVISFAALGIFWPEPRLEPRVIPELSEDRPPSGPLVWALASLGVVAFCVVLAAATVGSTFPSENLAPVALYVTFWVGMTVVSALVFDVWNSGFDPLATFGRFVASDNPRPYALGHWPAAAGLLAFVWIELVLPSRAEPRLLAVLIVVYTAVVVAGAAWWGRPWLRQGEAFAAWFGLLGAIAPIGRDDTTGGIRLRVPLRGLAELQPTSGTVGLVIVALGSTAFDGLTRSGMWTSLVGARSATEAMPLSTVGLLWSIGVVALMYLGAMKVAASMTGSDTAALADAFVHSLVPIAFAYAIAHYFSLLVLEGQAVLALVSDPFSLGWNLFGTAEWSINYALVSPNTIAYVQVAAIVIGHVAGVVLAHDRALRAVSEGRRHPFAISVAGHDGCLHRRRLGPPPRRLTRSRRWSLIPESSGPTRR